MLSVILLVTGRTKCEEIASEMGDTVRLVLWNRVEKDTRRGKIPEDDEKVFSGSCLFFGSTKLIKNIIIYASKLAHVDAYWWQF